MSYILRVLLIVVALPCVTIEGLSAQSIGLDRCGTGAATARVFQGLGQTKDPDSKAQAVFEPPVLQDSLISNSGLFKVYFDRSGPNAASQDILGSIGDYCDSAFALTVTELGYGKPPFSSPDSTYHVYLLNIQPNYGITFITEEGALSNAPTGLPRRRSYIELDNDFLESSFYTKGLEAAKITIAHEFHHLIQFSVYGINARDNYFQEMTSTWLEKRSTPQTRDYLQYLPRYFQTVDQKFQKTTTQGLGYEMVVWPQYLQATFGDAVIRRAWELYSLEVADPLRAFEHALEEQGSTFCESYKRFGAELFFTGPRYRGRSPFPDARLFPIESLKVERVAANEPVQWTAFGATLKYVLSGFGVGDSSIGVITRDTNLLIASNATFTITGPDTYAATYQTPSAFCDTLIHWRSSGADVFPQPFIIHTGSFDTLSIQVTANSVKPLTTYMGIYTSSMEEVTHSELAPVGFTGNYYALWDGRDAKGRLVSSGIYLYVIDTGDQRKVGKIAVIRK